MRSACAVCAMIGALLSPLVQPAVARQPGERMWSRVANCESGGWIVSGSLYPDPFGITAANWHAVGGHDLPVGSVTGKARRYATLTANRVVRYIRANYYPEQTVPDQGPLCEPGGW